MNCHTLVISDIHLGNNGCNADALLKILKKINTKNIIIVGDLFDSKYFHRLTKKHWEILSTLRRLSKNTNIILTLGNHDFYDKHCMEHLIGYKTYDHYTLTINNKRFIFIHGHIFDFLMTNYKTISDISSEIYYYLTKNDFIKKYFNQWLHDKTKSIFRIDRKLKEKAIQYAFNHNFDAIICGHTHVPELIKQNNIIYANSGAFTLNTPSYLTINKNGFIKLHSIKN